MIDRFHMKNRMPLKSIGTYKTHNFFKIGLNDLSSFEKLKRFTKQCEKNFFINRNLSES